MRLIKLNIILFLAVVFNALNGTGQNYPVTAFINVSGPYSSYLPDYADPFDNRMKIILTNTDFAAPSLSVKIRISIDGNGYSMQTADILATPTIILSPGVPHEITGADLQPYLSTSNLNIQEPNPGDYEATKVLPGGPATICVEVIDWQSGNQSVISNPACGTYWFEKYEPPILMYPACNQKIENNMISDPAVINFNWTPNHGASPNFTQTTYTFELWQVYDENLPNNVIGNDLLIYTESFIIAPNLTFVNPPTPLIMGNKYKWRVKAVDPTGRDVFTNQGWSEVCTFQYGDPEENAIAGQTVTLESNGTGTRQGTAWWNASNIFDKYILEVRKTGNSNYEWFPYETDGGDYKVNSLEPSTEYECRVKGVLGNAETEWSNVSTFTTLPQQTFGCGSTNMPGRNPNIIPAEFLQKGDIISVGQFEVYVTAADPGSQPGRFTGYGRVNIPFMFMNMNVGFTEILVDEDLKLRDGKVEALTEGVDAWMHDQFTNYIEGVVDEVQVDPVDSVFVFYLGNGDTMHIEWPTNGPVTYEDESGKIITVFPDGTFTITGQFNFDQDNLMATKDRQIYFKPSNQASYGFDEQVGILEWQERYPVILLSDSSLYWVPYKCVGSNQTDEVLAIVRGSDIGTPLFEDKNNNPCPATQINDSTYRVTVGNITNAGIQVYAYDDQYQKIGKLNLLNYASKVHEVVVVPVDNATPPDKTTLETYLNETFSQAYAFWTVTIDSAFNYQGDVGTNGVDAPDATLMKKYSPEMRDIRDAYFDSRSKDNKFYLFVVDDIEGDLDGYMVRGKSVGFIEKNQSVNTYAHELGHGAYGLNHTFDLVAQGSTNNLMDYHDPGATEINHLTASQWDKIHSWDPTWSILDDEEDGGYILSVIDYKCISPNITKSGNDDYYYDLDGGIIKLNIDYLPYAFVGPTEGQEDIFGNLAAIQRVSDGKLFLPKSSSNGSNKHGYFTSHFGITEDYTYDTNIDPTATPKKVKVQHDCSYQIEVNGAIVDSDIHSNCENCPGIQKILVGENNKSFFTSKDPNFYTKLFESDSSFTESFNSAIDKAVTIVNNSIGNINANYPADDDVKIHILNFEQYKNNTLLGINGGKDQALKEIENLLQDLHRTTSDYGDPIHFIVMFQHVDFIVDNNLWNIYSGKVLSKSNLKNLDDVVLITIPFSLPAFSGSPNYQKAFWMPGLSMTKPNRVNTSNLGTESYDPEDFEIFVKDVFVETVKPFDYYSYVVDTKGHVQLSRIGISEWKSGYEVVNELVISYDPNLYTYNRALEVQRLKQEATPNSTNTYTLELWASDLEEWANVRLAYDEGTYSPTWKSSKINLKSYCIRQYHSHYFNHFLADNFDDFKIDNDLTDPGSVPSYAKINPLEDDPFLEGVDFFSLLTATVGLDVVFDAIGAIYVYSVAPENDFEISARTAAVMLPFMNGGAVKIGKEGVEEVTIIALKKFGKKGPGNLDWIDNLIGNQWDEISKNALRSDLNGNPQMAALFREADELKKADYAEAWNLIRKARGNNSIFKSDIHLLKKTDELRANNTFMQRVGGEQGLEDIIKANVRARCKSCGNNGANYLKHIDEYLGDVENLVVNYDNIDGFDNVLNDIKLTNFNSTPNLNVEGAAFMIRVLNDNEALFLGKITKFEGSIDDLVNGCRFDIEFTNGGKLTFGEFKSYDNGSLSSFLSSKSTTYQQFTSYLQKINSLDELRYFFDVNKVSDVSVIKNRFKQVFTENAEYIFNLNEDLFKQFDKIDGAGKIEFWDDFYDLVSNPNLPNSHPMFNFIKLF